MSNDKPHPLEHLLDKSLPLELVKTGEDASKFLGQWVVLRSNSYYFTNVYHRSAYMIGKVGKERHVCEGSGKKNITGYHLYRIHDDVGGNCMLIKKQLSMDYVWLTEKKTGDPIVEMRILTPTEIQNMRSFMNIFAFNFRPKSKEEERSALRFDGPLINLRSGAEIFSWDGK